MQALCRKQHNLTGLPLRPECDGDPSVSQCISVQRGEQGPGWSEPGSNPGEHFVDQKIAWNHRNPVTGLAGVTEIY